MSQITISEQEIAALVGGDLFLSTGAEISGIHSLDQASPQQASFLGNEKYYQDFLQTRAGLVLAPTLVQEAPPGVAIVHVENPSLAFSALAEAIVEQAQAVPLVVSPRSIVAESAVFPQGEVAIMAGAIVGERVSIGAGSVIHPGVVLCDDVHIGENTLVYPNCVVRENCSVGSHVILQPGCVIGSDGYGFELVDGVHKKIPQIGTVRIEDHVELGANCCIDRARFGETVIGTGTKIDNLVQIAHNVKIGAHNLIVAQTGIAGSSETEQYVTVGAQCGIAGHLKIVEGALIASQSGVTKSLNKPGPYQGSPARPMASTTKSRALVNRLPKLMDRIAALEARLAELESK